MADRNESEGGLHSDRPNGTGTGHIGGIQTEDFIPDDSGGRKPRSDRGKPRGPRGTSGSGPREKASKTGTVLLSPDVLAGGISAAHEVAAKILKQPGLELDEKECSDLAAALIRLQSFYPDVDVPAKAMAWGTLAMVCGKIYVPRIIAIASDKKPGVKPIR